jgi:DNA (cytosine-5)-methyltransferase 1
MKVLDLCCKAGGTSKGYSDAGFEVEGVDIEPQPKYPFRFHQADGLEFLAQHAQEYDLISVSPPCQKYSKSTKQWQMEGREYPDLIARFRELLIQSGKPYVIENVPGAPLINPIFLNGAMFRIFVHRPRYFECSFPVIQPFMPVVQKPVKMGRACKEGDYIQPVGNFIGVEYARRQMGIGWMGTLELSQAIPPVYTRYIGEQFLAYTEGRTLVSLPTGTFLYTK